MAPRQQHFMVVAYPAQGHINPGLQLAKRLARISGARVTFSTAVSGHRRMFPCLSSPEQEVDDGLVNYIPYSDGYDDGFKGTLEETADFMADFRKASAKSISALFHRLRYGGEPVTCVIFSLLLDRAADVAHEFGIPSAVYWIQAATVFAMYYHFFHGYEKLIASHGDDPLYTVDLPGLPPFQIRDLPSFLTITSDDPFSFVLTAFRDLFDTLDRDAARGKRPWVLVNTYDALEPEGLAAVKQLDVVAIGPLLPKSFLDGGKEAMDAEPWGDLFKPDEKNYMEWLDSKPDGSVVYISFGSLLTMNKKQLKEMSRGLAESQRPYLWVVRKSKGAEDVALEEDREKGMVVGWCSQMRVLSHPAVGCFVTHCGWNSTLESLTCGVPMVGVPQWTDQATNATLVEKVWGAGVRAALNFEGEPGALFPEGVLERAELWRCLGVVMGDGERGSEIRSGEAMWQCRASEAVMEGGSSDRNLKAFVEEIMATE